MKKIIFALTAVLTLSMFAFTGCDNRETATGKLIEPQSIEENAEETDETPDENQIEHDHSDFKFVPKPIKGTAVSYDGDVYIIHFGNHKRHRHGVCPNPPQNPTEPDDTDNNDNN